MAYFCSTFEMNSYTVQLTAGVDIRLRTLRDKLAIVVTAPGATQCKLALRNESGSKINSFNAAHLFREQNALAGVTY